MMLRPDFLLACGSTILASTLRGGVPGRAPLLVEQIGTAHLHAAGKMFRST